jgi:hypothetical protein
MAIFWPLQVPQVAASGHAEIGIQAELVGIKLAGVLDQVNQGGVGRRLALVRISVAVVVQEPLAQGRQVSLGQLRRGDRIALQESPVKEQPFLGCGRIVVNEGAHAGPHRTRMGK